jgi:hypothetical protein
MTENQQQIATKYRNVMKQNCRSIYNNYLKHLTDEEFLEAMVRVANAADEEEIGELLYKREFLGLM